MLNLPRCTVAHHGSPHPALPIKQPCSSCRIETDFVQVIILDKQLAVINNFKMQRRRSGQSDVE
jgi:hypothetical protein